LDSLDKFLEFRIEKIASGQSIPVDIAAICDRLGAVVEEREMIPEAAMQVINGQFRIYLQSNFTEAPGSAMRRRFSLAHELGHILFYDQQNGEMKPRQDSPRGDSLEAACHKAASMILVPSKVLKPELKQRPPANANDVIELANRFEVSTEVMLRRLNEFGTFEHGWAPVLTRRSGTALTIEYATHPPWLKPHLNAPGRGASFNGWFRGSEQPDGTFKKETPEGTLDALPVNVTGSSIIFELRMQSQRQDIVTA
jgi:Zn-dependent peptidase ImmA (M78 family)